MVEMTDGFSELITDLEELSRKATNKETKRKALDAGAKPIISRAKRIAKQHKRTGTLEDGIIIEYDESSDTTSIGWSKEAFYGRFLDNGFDHVGGKHVQVPHLKSSYEAEKENVLNNMLAVYEQEFN